MKERERVEAEDEHVEAARKKQEEERKKESQKVLINTQEMLCGICFFKVPFQTSTLLSHVMCSWWQIW